MAEVGIVKAVRLDDATIARITAHVERLQAKLGRMTRVNEGMAMRDIIDAGLGVVEGVAGEAVAVAKPVPAKVKAPAPQVAMVACEAGLGHPDYKSTAQRCPLCGRNARTKKYKENKKQAKQ